MFIGGSPIQQAPVYGGTSYGQPFPVASSVPAALAQQAYPQPPSSAQPVGFPQGWKAPRPPVQQAAAPRLPAQPLVRAKPDDDPPLAPVKTVVVALPSPEALGIATTSAPAAPAQLDWNATRARLHQLSAQSFNVVKLPSGAFRMVISLPTANPNQAYLVEVEADAEATAVANALQRAEEWTKH